jgi:hypothetical protein
MCESFVYIKVASTLWLFGAMVKISLLEGHDDVGNGVLISV